jgi:hypothetical protein
MIISGAREPWFRSIRRKTSPEVRKGPLTGHDLKRRELGQSALEFASKSRWSVLIAGRYIYAAAAFELGGPQLQKWLAIVTAKDQIGAPLNWQEPAMANFIHEANIALFKKCLSRETDLEKTKVLKKLLAEEEVKLADWHVHNPKPNAAEYGCLQSVGRFKLRR